MASKVSGMIEKLTINSTTHAIASTAYGYCETPAATQIKDVDMTGFVLYEGVTVHIKFANANTAANPKLKFNNEDNSNAKPIVQYGTTAVGTVAETSGWQAGAVLTLTYDGTSWIRDQGYNTWRPIGTGANDAMAGNTNVNNVSQGTTTTSNWKKILLSGQDYAAYNTAVGNDQNTVTYRAVGVSVQPSTGSMQISGTFTSNHLYTNTDATYDIGATATRWRTAYLTTSLLVGAKNTITAYNSNALGSFVGPGVFSSCVTSAGNGYYLFSKGVQYGQLYVAAVGVAGTNTTTYTNPDNSSQTVAGYSGAVTGTAYLILGNNKGTGSNGSSYSSPGSAGTADNAQGYLRLYSSSTGYADLTSFTGDKTRIYPVEGFALPENKVGIMFRPSVASHYTYISYQTRGHEALVFGTKQNVTSFIFVNGEDPANIAADRWTKLTGASGEGPAPGLQIKQNCVSIGKLIPNGVAPTYKLEVNGTSYLNGNTTINGNLIPGENNTKTLGSTDAKWAKLYIGDTTSYGDAYTPIYWNEGNPTAVTPIQYCTFTIGSGKKGVKLTHAAFTADSYVTQIVVISGESNLNSAIGWESAAGYINLACTAVTSGAVSGYILVSRGGAITATATDIT